MKNANELTEKKGIAKVSAKGDAKMQISDAIKQKLAKVNTEAKVAQSAKKSSSIWDLDKIRNSEQFKDVKHSSDSTVRNAIRKSQERICMSILHNAKTNLDTALQSNFAELQKINSFLKDKNIFANKKRSNFTDLQLAYEIFAEMQK